MAQVVLGEEQPLLPGVARRPALELAAQQVLQEQLLAQPDRDRHAERGETPRREREVGLEQALELQERLVVEHDMVERFRGDAGFFQAPGDGVVRKGRVVLPAGEARLLRRGHDAAVLDQRGRAVVVEGRDP